MTQVKIEPKAEEAVKLAASKKAEIEAAKNPTPEEPEKGADGEEADVAPKVKKAPTLADLVKDSQKRTARLMKQNGRAVEVKRQHPINANKGAK